MKPGRHFCRVVVCAVVAAAASPAFADAIDGNWCAADGRRLEIAGPSIVTPGGNRIDGDYERHAFSYIVPAGETGAGSRVDMDLLGEYDMQLWPKGRGAEGDGNGPQHWKRCAAPTS